jgi:hypothetical protein
MEVIFHLHWRKTNETAGAQHGLLNLKNQASHHSRLFGSEERAQIFIYEKGISSSWFELPSSRSVPSLNLLQRQSVLDILTFI